MGALGLLVTHAAGSDRASVLGAEFALVLGPSGQLGCLPRSESQAALADLVQAQSKELSIDPQLAVVFSLDVPICADLFYAAVANDVRGIGYQHFFDEETFDESPTSSLEGVAFLNDVLYWETHEEELIRAFLHEVGHRWGARVRVDGPRPRALLGRDDEHWSYFLDTRGEGSGLSPLEGNIWLEDSPGIHTSESHGRVSTYSALDLYLMGVLSAASVGPLVVLEPSSSLGGTDCRGGTVGSASPPQSCEPMTIEAAPALFSIEDVIAVEGPREPPAVEAAPVVKTVGFFLLAPADRVLSEADCASWNGRIDGLVTEFDRATDGRLLLENVTRGEASCAVIQDLTLPSPEPGATRGGGCTTAPGPPAPLRRFWLLVFGVVVTSRIRIRWNRAPFPSG